MDLDSVGALPLNIKTFEETVIVDAHDQFFVNAFIKKLSNPAETAAFEFLVFSLEKEIKLFLKNNKIEPAQTSFDIFVNHD